MPTVAGCGIGGKNANRKVSKQNASAKQFIRRPVYDPRLKGEGKRGSLRIRRQVMHPMDAMYDDTNATVPTDMIMFHAIAEPILIQWKMQAMTEDRIMALVGTTNRGETRDIQGENGRARSRAKAKVCRDAPAMLVILLTKLRTISRTLRPIVPATEPVAE
jgi:hypothetical protein